MNPQVYLVGGAVRDKLLNRDSNDHDYVVVGANPQWMLDQGFTQVGASFPVFLHPTTGEEYALARQERKTGPGYHGFEVEYDSSVTLEDDLLRRDLTINAMAMTESGELIDPYNGYNDLKYGILRHTSNAFADDPLRVLRLARFAARYGFTVHYDTIQLARELVNKGELDHLPKERIWAELFKGLSEPNPVRMVEVLDAVGALKDSPVGEYFPKHVVSFIPWINNIFNSMIEGGVDLDIDIKFLILMSDVVDEHDDYEKFARSLCIPSYFSGMARKMIFFADRLVTPRLITEDQVFQIFEETKYLREHDNNDWKNAIRTLQIEEWFSAFKTQFGDNLKLVNNAASYIKQIDMRTVTEGDKSTIVDRVKTAKRQAIKRAFEAYENEPSVEVGV